MHIARVVGWKKGETPTVAQGLKIEALATGLAASALALCAAQWRRAGRRIEGAEGRSPIKRPKDIVMGWIESWATSGGDTGPSNRITLLRDANGDGVPETQSVFLDHLNSPFGVALVGNDLYVANTDAIVRYPYHDGDTKITAPGTTLTPLPGGPIDHHWTKSLVASPDGTQALCRRRLQQQHHRERHGGRDRTAPRFWRSIAPPAAGASSPAACATRTA